MQQRLGVTHISGRPVLTLGLSTTSRLKSRDPPVTQPSFHTAPSPAGTSGGGSVFGSAQGTHSMESSWPLECWPVWPLLPLKTASCFRQPHGLPHRTAQRCLCTLSRVPSPLGLNQPHHPSQISTGTGSFNHLWQTANNTSPVSRQRLATSSSSKSRPQTGRRILDKGSLVSTHPTIITSFVRMMSFFLLPSSSSCRVVVGSRFDSSPPSSRQVRSPLRPRDGAMIGLGSVKPHVNPPSHSHSHSSEHGMAVWYFIHTSCLVVGSSGMPVIATAGLGKFPGGLRCLAFPGGRGSLCSTRLWSLLDVWQLHPVSDRRLGLRPRTRAKNGKLAERRARCMSWHSVLGAYPSMRILPRKASSISPHPVGVEMEARRGDPGKAVPVRRNQPCLFFAVEATPDFKVPRRCRH